MAVKFEKIVKDTVDTMKKASKPKTSEYDVNGIVKRVDGKTAWVHFDGGIDETPVRMTISARKGDKVRVHVGGGKAYITGNETAPPTDDGEARKATKYAGEAKKAADNADAKADNAQKSADEAMNATESLAEDVSTLSDDVDGISDLVGDGDESGIEVITQYYLSTSNSSLVGGEWVDSLPTYVSGKYYWTRTVTIYADGSEVEGTPTLDVTNQIAAEVNALATATDQHFWHDSTGAYVTRSDKNVGSDYAMKFTNQGILQTYNGKNLMALTGSGLSLYQSDGSTPMAIYSSTGATIYSGGSPVASFGSDVVIGGTSSTETNLRIYTSSGNAYFDFRKGTSVIGQIYYWNNTLRILSSSIDLYTTSNSDGININSSNVGVSIPLIVYSSAQIYSSLSVYSSITASTSITANGNGDAVTADNGYIKNKYAMDNIGSGAVNLHMGPQGRILATDKSSRRYKNSIASVELPELDPHHLYDVDVIQFKFNTDYLKNSEDIRYDRPVIGFIAEQVYEHYPVAVDLDEDGKPDNWNNRYIIPPMLALIQEQKKEIDHLTDRVKMLEERSA